MKYILPLIMLFVFGEATVAQGPKKQQNAKIFFSSHIGLGKISGDLKENFANGFQAMTGVEYKFAKHSSIVGELNFDGYGYKKASNTFNLSGTVNIVPATLFYKYAFGNSKLLPYIKIGAGAAKVSAPEVTEKMGFTTIQNNSTIVGHAQIALGLNYEFRKGYFVFLESALQHYGNIKVLSNKSILVNSFRVGVSTAL